MHVHVHTSTHWYMNTHLHAHTQINTEKKLCAYKHGYPNMETCIHRQVGINKNSVWAYSVSLVQTKPV